MQPSTTTRDLSPRAASNTGSRLCPCVALPYGVSEGLSIGKLHLVGAKEHSSMACEYRTEGVECLLTQHATSAPVVIDDRRKWP